VGRHAGASRRLDAERAPHSPPGQANLRDRAQPLRQLGRHFQPPDRLLQFEITLPRLRVVDRAEKGIELRRQHVTLGRSRFRESSVIDGGNGQLPLISRCFMVMRAQQRRQFLLEATGLDCAMHPAFLGAPVSHRQRPDRGSVPSPTARVHGEQPIDLKPLSCSAL